MCCSLILMQKKIENWGKSNEINPVVVPARIELTSNV